MRDRLVLSPDRQHKGGIEIDFSSISCNIAMVFYSRHDALVKRIPLIDVRPGRTFAGKFLGKSRWMNADNFRLSSKSDEIHFIASLNGGGAAIEFTPHSKSKELLVDDILVASVNTPDNQALHLIRT